LKKERVELYMRNTSGMIGELESYNVVAEVKGSEFPEEIIVVGGHLDSWDVGGGAHDDGSGCVQSMQVLELFKKLNYRPKRTLRIVMFMNEENGLSGGTTYAALAKANGENHLAALESDRGGFTPRGFSCTADESVFTDRFKALKAFSDVLEPYGLHINNGGGGADIGPLKDQGTLLIGLVPDSQRYFDFHHTEADVIEAVNERELKMGAAAMASLVYMIDKYGL
jgi:Zn-dependent M28 family amino/carboxypeptidase